MALIKGLGLLVASILAAVLSRIVVEEVGAWSPSIVRSLIKLAVARLPENQRARFEEEWQSHVDEVPGTVGKLLAAAGFSLAARKMAPTAQRSRIVEDWLQKVARLEDSRSKIIMVISTIRDANGLGPDLRIELKPHMDRLSSLGSERKELQDQLAAVVSAYSVPPTSLAANLLDGRKRRLVQKTLDQALRGAEEVSKKSDQIIKALGGSRTS